MSTNENDTDGWARNQVLFRGVDQSRLRELAGLE